MTQVCRDSGLAYYHGPRTITYTALVLYNDEAGTPVLREEEP